MKLKDILNENFALMSPIVTPKAINSIGTGIKMADLVEDYEQVEERQIDTNSFLGMVNRFGRIGEDIKVNDLRGNATALQNIAETAKLHTESLQEDWFDKITVTRNMKELNNHAKSFNKIADEAANLQERMSGLYEDMGNIMGRYYDISETIDEEDSEYQKFFRSALNKFGVDSPADLDGDKEKEFYNHVDKNYKAKDEED
tara:strand:+ start:311 stop:913 length:603 start_codon:yes stop_codon:yes gene_type:complete